MNITILQRYRFVDYLNKSRNACCGQEKKKIIIIHFFHSLYKFASYRKQFFFFFLKRGSEIILETWPNKPLQRARKKEFLLTKSCAFLKDFLKFSPSPISGEFFFFFKIISVPLNDASRNNAGDNEITNSSGRCFPGMCK